MHGSTIVPSFINAPTAISSKSSTNFPTLSNAAKPTITALIPQQATRNAQALRLSAQPDSLRQAGYTPRLTHINQLRTTKQGPHAPALFANNPAQTQDDFSSTENATGFSIEIPENLVKSDRGDLILTPLPNKKGDTQSIVFMPGAETRPEQYLSLAQKLQAASPAPLWIGIAKYDMPLIDFDICGKKSPQVTLEGYTNPLAINGEADAVINAMHSAGMKNTKPFIAGHSLGGAFLHNIAKDSSEKYSGLIHLSSFLPRRLDDEHPAQHMPSLTISGDLDGLVSIMRIAECYHHNVERAEAEARDPLNSPVVVIEGANHGSFFEGPIPAFVAAHDLSPEAEHSYVQNQVAQTITNFIESQSQSGDENTHEVARNKLVTQVEATGELLAPLIDALKLEGSYHLKYPCSMATKADPDDCWVGSPWVEQVTPFVTGADKDGVSIVTRDEFNPSWIINLPLLTEPGKPTFHHPKVTAPDEDGPIAIDTVSEAVYNQIDERFDTGITPCTAQRIRAKFPSRQAVQEAAGNRVGFDPDNNENIASKINQMAIDWALSHASPKARARYEAHGVPLVAGKDFDVHKGPDWIWSNFEKRLTKDDQGKPQYVIDAAVMRAPTESAVQKIPFLPSKITKGVDKLIGGKHFTTLLSPAEAMRHIYEDSLRPLPKRNSQSAVDTSISDKAKRSKTSQQDQ